MRIEAVWLSQTPVVSTSPAYASGDAIGGLMTFDLSGFKPTTGLLLQAATLYDKAKQSALIDCILFDSNPSSTTFTDNAALAVNAADLGKIIGVVQLSSYAAFSANSVAYAAGIAVPIQGLPNVASPSLYASLVSRGTPTYASTSDVSLRLGFVML
jgi:hypothetical protein